MIFDILITTVSCLIFQWLISIVIVGMCGKPKKRPMPATSAASKTPINKTPEKPSASTQSTFAESDDPKYKSCYGVDDGVFKKKEGTTSVDEKVPAGKDSNKKKNNKDGEKKSPKKDSPNNRKKIEKDGNNDNNKGAEKKKSDSNNTDLRSLTLEKNLAEAAKIKNPAAINRSNRYIKEKDGAVTSDYAIPPPPPPPAGKKDAAVQDPKKNAAPPK